MSEGQEKKEDEGWVDVGRYPSLDDAFDHALVALASGAAIKVEHGAIAGEFDLLADAESVEKIAGELDKYREEESVGVSIADTKANWTRYSAGFPILLVWIGVLIAVFSLQIRDASFVGRYASSNLAFLEGGEWWRPFTALFLHGDGAHLAGNLVTGSIFAIMASKTIGPLRAWCLILLSGVLGNAMTSWVTYPEPFVSLGASTAVFGALGVLSGVGLVENVRQGSRLSGIRVLAPVIAGVVLLGWWGGAEAGSNTDVFGHVFGFFAGIVTGAFCRYLMKDEIVALRASRNGSNEKR